MIIPILCYWTFDRLTPNLRKMADSMELTLYPEQPLSQIDSPDQGRLSSRDPVNLGVKLLKLIAPLPNASEDASDSLAEEIQRSLEVVLGDAPKLGHGMYLEAVDGFKIDYQLHCFSLEQTIFEPADVNRYFVRGMSWDEVHRRDLNRSWLVSVARLQLLRPTSWNNVSIHIG